MVPLAVACGSSLSIGKKVVGVPFAVFRLACGSSMSIDNELGGFHLRCFDYTNAF